MIWEMAGNDTGSSKSSFAGGGEFPATLKSNQAAKLPLALSRNPAANDPRTYNNIDTVPIQTCDCQWNTETSILGFLGPPKAFNFCGLTLLDPIIYNFRWGWNVYYARICNKY